MKQSKYNYKYLYEYGINWYKSFNSLKEVKKFQKKRNDYSGYLYTPDGHPMDLIKK